MEQQSSGQPEVHVLIVAGGQGTRMGMALPKQFLPLCGQPVLYHTLKAFVDALPQAQLTLVLPVEHMSYAQMVLQAFGDERIDLRLVAGGNTRYQSVKNGLATIPANAIVLVHDGVRPLVSRELIQRCVALAQETGCAIPAITAVDSMRLVDALGNSKPIVREQVRVIQTPQTFKAGLLQEAFEQEYQEAFTDEATVLQLAGGAIHFVEGERGNIKITTPVDMAIAEALMRYQNEAV